MPLEISEIGVRIAVGETPPAPPAPAGASGVREGAGLTPARIEEIVQACVQDVLRTLRMREER